MSRVSEVLSRAIDLESLIQKQPELFDIASLDITEKMRLLSDRPKIFASIVGPTITDPIEKSLIIRNIQHKVVREIVELSEDELAKLDSDTYFFLLSDQFKKYVRVDLFTRLPAKRKSSLTAANPKWVFENITPAPRLTSDVLAGISRTHPSLIDTYVTDFTQHATTAAFWRNMIRFNDKYRMLFLKNTKSLITKTDVRGVIKTYPSLIKELNEEIIADSKLTVKEWVLLCDTVAEAKDLAGWEFSDEMKEIFRLDSLADLLSGKAKLTRRFTNAMASVLSDTEDDAIKEADKEAAET